MNRTSQSEARNKPGNPEQHKNRLHRSDGADLTCDVQQRVINNHTGNKHKQ